MISLIYVLIYFVDSNIQDLGIDCKKLEIYLKKMGLKMPKCFIWKHKLPYFNIFLASSVIYHSPHIYKRDPIKFFSTCLGTVCRPAYHYLWTPIDQIPEKTLFWKINNVQRRHFPFFKKRGMYRPCDIMN